LRLTCPPLVSRIAGAAEEIILIAAIPLAINLLGGHRVERMIGQSTQSMVTN